MYNYHCATPHSPNVQEYPTISERLRFLEAYVAHGPGTTSEKEATVQRLEKEIKDWRTVSHAFWCVWAVILSEDDPEVVKDLAEDDIVIEERVPSEEGASTSDFDYIAYADQKMRLFWGELERTGLLQDLIATGDGCDGQNYILP